MPNTLTFVHCKLFPAMESLVSDIPTWDGNIGNLFLECGRIFTEGVQDL
jgi:hypothetical protein